MNKYYKECTAKLSTDQLIKLNKEGPIDDYVDVVVKLDVYDILEAFEVQPSLVNAVKKCLKPGSRHGAKNKIEDLQEAMRGIIRVIEIEKARL
jgi:hypothetical protein